MIEQLKAKKEAELERVGAAHKAALDAEERKLQDQLESA